MHRPTTRGELKRHLQAGNACEVVCYVSEMTTIMLRGWMHFEEFTTRLSDNKGWMIFEPTNTKHRRKTVELDPELPPISFTDHNSLLNEAVRNQIAFARKRGAKEEVIKFLLCEGKALLLCGYNSMRDNAS